MPAVHYPFIDIAVHGNVRARFARGEALVLFSPGMDQVLWANGAGTAFFGGASIYDFLDQPPPQQDVTFRQIAAVARSLKEAGEARKLMVRVGAGFRSLPVEASLERLEIVPGEGAVLFAVPQGHRNEQARTAAMLSGFDDPDTHMALMDRDGRIVAASEHFLRLGISSQTALTLVRMVSTDEDGLVKRPIPTSKGYLPAAIGKLSDDPGLFLVFAVETILGMLDPAEGFQAAEPEVPAAEPAAPANVFADVVEALGHIEEIAAEPEDVSFEAPAPFIGTEAQDEPQPETSDLPPVAEAQDAPEMADADHPCENAAAEDAPKDEAEQVLHVTEQQDAQALHAPAPAAAMTDPALPQEEPPAEPPLPSFAFERSGRAQRFVWKIDALGRFSEVSGEFAKAVGPRAAAIEGQTFSDLAALFNLDPDGKIGDLLKRRDTWSGRTIYWPVEGTSLKVPVDLAALPTYTRNRDFDGFRGFGVVRIADAVEDAEAVGLTFLPRSGETEMADSTAGEGFLFEEEAAEGGAPSTALEDPAPAEPDTQEPAVQEPADPVIPAEEPPLPEPPVKEPHADAGAIRPEPPALHITETAARRLSDKIIQLEERRFRARDGLSNSEQAAFREIARKLDAMGIPPRSDEAGQATEEKVEATETRQGPQSEGPAPVSESAGPATVEPVEENITVLPLARRDASFSADMLDMLPLALLAHRGDRLIHANREFLALTGYDSLEALSDAGGLDALLQRDELNADEAEPGSLVIVRADDALVPVSARLQSIRWEDAGALLLALVPTAPDHGGTETTPPHRHEPQAPSQPEPVSTPQPASSEVMDLRIEVEELRSILETATDGVVTLGAEGDIRSINRAASALFNYDEEEIRGKPFVTLFAHESQRSILDYLSGLAGHGVASVLNDGREVIGREASGGFIPLFMTIGRLSSSSGYCAVIRDITQWKRTEEELRSAKRAAETANAHKTDFLARVSHEIRTPLNAIIGFSDIMADERFGPIGHARYSEYAADIGRSGRHVLDIVNDLLDISKIEAGEMDLDFVAVGLNETVSEAVAIVQPQANNQRVIIRTALSQSVPNVVADLRSVKQIVLNILANAIRFTPSGGQIIVSTAYEPNGSVTLRIRDTGIGMSRSELEQAMKPFRQVAPGGTRLRGDGTGLGLPLTKAMVDANRAQFSIHSTPNEGTLVEITFPSPRVLAS
ncbi:ATP-binding protein [Allorhizobium undicola]|uniref:ATP-binding protein n=1 Tax=Allorhizobium undicola TaxID=78527 RepID=UPI000482E211|nr:ATP-binding protein [Allorhizobium undicola]